MQNVESDLETTKPTFSFLAIFMIMGTLCQGETVAYVTANI